MRKKEKYFDAEKLVDEALIAELGFELSDSFADVVAQKAGRRFAWQQYSKEFLIYLGVFVGAGVVWAVLSFVFFGADWRVWFDFAVSNMGLIVGINIITVFVLFADRVLLRYFMFRAEAG
jgi:hypothetical protein